MSMIRYYVISFVFISLFAGCTKQPITLGLSVQLTGTRGDLGVDLRDGVLLAVKEINDSGGIDGRKIELIIMDDQGDPEKARQVDNELIDRGVAAIIGHVTSSQTAAVLDLINERKIVLFSPSSTSPLFSGKDDYFFRNVISADLYGRALARYLIEEKNLHNISVIYDISNEVYSVPLWETTEELYTSLGGEVEEVFSFKPDETDLHDIVESFLIKDPSAVQIIASPVDTAIITQLIRKNNSDIPIFGCSWAKTKTLIEKGGAAVEGIELITRGDDFSSQKYTDFKLNFETEYKRSHGLLAPTGYEALRALTWALEEVDFEISDLKDGLKYYNNMETVLGKISLDEFGDINRDVSLVKIENSDFVELKRIRVE